MKKLVCALCVLACIAVLFGCAAKGMTADKFSEKMEAAGFQITDVSDQFAQYDHILNVTFARSDDYTVQYFTMNSPENAKAMLDGNVKSIKGETSDETVFSGVYDGKYYYIKSFDVYMLYVSADASQENSVKALVASLEN